MVRRNGKVDNFRNSLFLLNIIIIIIIIIISSSSSSSSIYTLEVFTSALVVGLSLEFEWQQVS